MKIASFSWPARLLVAFLVVGCSAEDQSERAKKTIGSTEIASPATFEPGSLAIVIVNELNRNLINRSSLTAEQAREVSLQSVGNLEIEKTGLRLQGSEKAEGYENRIEEFVDELTEGAIAALDGLENIHQRQLNKVLDVIVSSVVSSLKGRSTHLDTAQLSQMLYLIAEGSMVNLDEAGYSTKSMAEGARVLVASAIGSLDDSEVLTEANGKDILIAIVGGAVQGMSESSLAGSTSKVADYSFVLDDLLYGAVGSLDDAGFTLDQIDNSISYLIFASISKFDELGFTALNMEALIEAAMHGALDGLKREAGISEAAQIEEALAFCVGGAVESLAHTGLSLDEMDEVIAVIVKKAVEHVDNLGISHQETETAIEKVVLAAIHSLDEAGFATEHVDEYGDVMGDLTVSAIAGLAEVGFTSLEIEGFLDDIIASIFVPLREHQFTKDQSTLIGTHFKTALAAGLSAQAAIGFAYDDAVVSAHVLSAIDAAYSE